MHFHNLLVFLFEPLATSKAQGVGCSDESANTPSSVSPQELTALSKASMEFVIRLYYRRHGLRHCDTLMATYLHFIGFNALQTLLHSDSARRNAVLSTVVLCAQGLHYQSWNYYIAEAILTLFRDSMDINTAGLLRDFVKIDKEAERKENMGCHR